jgi:beta-xylosidase
MTMKIKFHYIILALLLLGTACKKDNFKAPSSTLKGRLTYKGDPINLEYNQVPFELYQPGFGKIAPIRGTFDQDGSYSTLLFDGNYKFTIPANQGPFMWKELSAGKRDTLAVTVSGNQTMDIEVNPYYMVRGANITAASNSITATFNIEKVITGADARNIEKVYLYVNKTQFVSGTDNTASASIEAAAITSLNNISLNVAIPATTPSQNYVFARVGIKIDGVEDLIFSPVTKVTY